MPDRVWLTTVSKPFDFVTQDGSNTTDETAIYGQHTKNNSPGIRIEQITGFVFFVSNDVAF